VNDALGMQLHYDGLDRISHVEDGTGSLLESYLYDGDGRMVSSFDHVANSEEVIVYDGEQMSVALDGQGASLWQATWGPAQTDQLSHVQDFVQGRDLIPLHDHRHNVIGVWDETADQMVELADFSPEGRLTVYDSDENVVCDERSSATTVCGAPAGLRFAFNSQWKSSRTGLSYMRNRWYSPRLAQFISHDPLEYIDSYNPFMFAALDPINMWDPYGLSGGDIAGWEAWRECMNSCYVSGPIPKGTKLTKPSKKPKPSVQEGLSGLSMASSVFPGAGDLIAFGADWTAFMLDPTPANKMGAVLSGAGLFPFAPSLGGWAKRGLHAWDEILEAGVKWRGIGTAGRITDLSAAERKAAEVIHDRGDRIWIAGDDVGQEVLKTQGGADIVSVAANGKFNVSEVKSGKLDLDKGIDQIKSTMEGIQQTATGEVKFGRLEIVGRVGAPDKGGTLTVKNG